MGGGGLSPPVKSLNSESFMALALADDTTVFCGKNTGEQQQ